MKSTVTKVLVPIILTAPMIGCGGGSSSNDAPLPAPPTPPANVSPQANADTASTADNAPISIDVLANDTDADNDTLSLSEIVNQPINGSVEVDGNEVVYTPNPLFAGEDSFSYTVSDGELTSEATVTVTSTQSLVLSGIVTDSPISNATVSVTLGDETFSAEADETGVYELNITLSSNTGSLLINAVGSEVNNQANVELIGLLGNAEEVLALLQEGRMIDADTDRAVNVSHVSTSELLLASDENEGVLPTSKSELKQAAQSISATDMVNLAALINLLVDNPDFSVPEGETTLSMFQTDSETSVEENIEGYLESIGALDEDGEPTEAYTSALDLAIDATLANADALPNFTEALISGNDLALISGDVVEGYIPFQGEILTLNLDGTGSFWEGSYASRTIESISISWTLNDGSIVASFGEHTGLGNLFNYDIEDVRRDYGEDAAIAAEAVSFGRPFVQVTETIRTTEQVLTPLSVSDSSAIVRVKESQERFITISDTRFYRAVEPTQSSMEVIFSTGSVYQGAAAEDIAGTWALPIYDENYTAVVDGLSFPSSIAAVVQDMFTLNEGSSVTGSITGNTYSWDVNEQGVISLSDETTRFEFTPFIKNDMEYLAKVKQYQDNTMVNQYIRKLVKGNDTAFTGADLVSEIPVIYHKIDNNGHEVSNWEDGMPKASSIFQELLLKSDGTHEAVSRRLEEGEEFFASFADTTDSSVGSWEENADGIKMHWGFLNASGLGLNQTTVLKPLGIDSQGRLLAIEIRSAYFEIQPPLLNGTYDEGEFVAFQAEPIIQVLIPLDLSQYTEAYENTVARGNLGL